MFDLSPFKGKRLTRFARVWGIHRRGFLIWKESDEELQERVCVAMLGMVQR